RLVQRFRRQPPRCFQAGSTKPRRHDILADGATGGGCGLLGPRRRGIPATGGTGMDAPRRYTAGTRFATAALPPAIVEGRRSGSLVVHCWRIGWRKLGNRAAVRV